MAKKPLDINDVRKVAQEAMEADLQAMGFTLLDEGLCKQCISTSLQVIGELWEVDKSGVRLDQFTDARVKEYRTAYDYSILTPEAIEDIEKVYAEYYGKAPNNPKIVEKLSELFPDRFSDNQEFETMINVSLQASAGQAVLDEIRGSMKLYTQEKAQVQLAATTAINTYLESVGITKDENLPEDQRYTYNHFLRNALFTVDIAVQSPKIGQSPRTRLENRLAELSEVAFDADSRTVKRCVTPEVGTEFQRIFDAGKGDLPDGSWIVGGKVDDIQRLVENACTYVAIQAALKALPKQRGGPE